VTFDNGKSLLAAVDTTILINTSAYLKSIMDELEKRHVEIQKVKLTKQDLAILNEQVIFNCSGLGSTELFDDKDLKPVRGYLIEFKPQKDINYFAYRDANKDSQYFTCMFSHQDKLLIGGSTEEDQWSEEIDEEVCRKILGEARTLFEPASIESSTKT